MQFLFWRQKVYSFCNKICSFANKIHTYKYYSLVIFA